MGRGGFASCCYARTNVGGLTARSNAAIDDPFSGRRRPDSGHLPHSDDVRSGLNTDRKPHSDAVRSVLTIDMTRVPAQKVDNNRSYRWIAIKSDLTADMTRVPGKRSITVDATSPPAILCSSGCISSSLLHGTERPSDSESIASGMAGVRGGAGRVLDPRVDSVLMLL
ncbi:hypothetical protein NC653_022221 [Populus alba x Populus x berolinensis]|uniref:Uncharacterized protein n=1 Tax=Populus alba x Populus x berolinensis TaxID=444605 RepID=A0AAD6QBF3_9ROSI|nr:hypothetical protein NC653_022221 [Populus alba x Populus x berolinensis]